MNARRCLGITSLTLAIFFVGALDGYAISVGDQAPELDAKGWLNTEPLSLEKLRGKIVVAEFWATWCGPCVASIPHLIKLHEKYHSKGVVLIGFTNEELAKIDAFVKKMKMIYALGYGSTTAGKYGVTGIPCACVIDPSGKLAWKGHPAQGLDQAIEEVLKKTPPVTVDPGVRNRAVKNNEEADKAVAGGDFALAIQSLKATLAIEGRFDEKDQAEKKLKEIEALAAAEVEGAVKKPPLEAVTALEAIELKYAGSETAALAKAKVEELGKDPGVKAAIEKSREENAANALLEPGKAALARKDFRAALLELDKVVNRYPDTAAGAFAKVETDKLRADKALMAKLDMAEKTKLASGLLRMAKSYLQSDATELASEKLQQIVRDYEGTPEAAEAKELLAKIK